MQQNEINYASISQSGITVLRNGIETSLHPYQQRAKDDIFKAFDIEDVNHPIVINANVTLPDVKAKYDPYPISLAKLMQQPSKDD